MKIKQSLEKFPGGMMIVPLLLGAIINTLFPNILRIGNFTEALFVDGSSTLIALFLLFTGAQINFKNVGLSLKKGATLLIVKWLVGILIGLLAIMISGINGFFLGMVPIAIISALTNSNGGLYVAMVGQYGNKTDRAAYSLLALNDGPFLTMVALAIFGTIGFVDGVFSPISFISVLLPIVIGMILGNLDNELRKFFESSSAVLIPFFAFSLGMGIDFKSIIEGGIPGIILGVITVFITGTTGYLVFRWFNWNPIAGAAEGSTAGNAVATPAAIAAASPAFSANVHLATVQIAAAVVVSAILLPLYIGFLVKMLNKKGYNVPGDFK